MRTDVRKLLSRVRRPLYADPRDVTDLDECYFYHTMEIPGHGLVEGQWDLREGITEYTGGVDFSGQRVLEVGTASGFLCFAMEQRGADVVAYDLSDEYSWDIVPIASLDWRQLDAERRAIMRKINNGWWFAHRAHASRAKVVYGTVYDIPLEIGRVDVATFCSVLLHLRDPFLALQNGLRLTAKTAIVTDVFSPQRGALEGVQATTPMMELVPNFREGGPPDTWWFLNPEIVQSFLGILGFEDTTVSYHRQKASWGEQPLFTVVGHRTAGHPVGG